MPNLEIVFKPDGTVEVSAEQNRRAELDAQWVLKELGTIERRGHRHSAKAEEQTQLKQQAE